MILDSFATYMETLGVATRGQDLFIGEAPSSDILNNKDPIWWIIDSGGQPIKKNSTGESMKAYSVQIYCRNRNVKDIKTAMFSLEENLNCDGCFQLDGFDTINIEASTFPIDQDIDAEDRKIGMLQVNLTIYKECS